MPRLVGKGKAAEDRPAAGGGRSPGPGALGGAHQLGRTGGLDAKESPLARGHHHAVIAGLAGAEAPEAAAEARVAASWLADQPLRKGKWTAEEEAYTKIVIEDFSAGLLDCVEGTTLRTYLADCLRCDPMRITKKFPGGCAIGKQVFRRSPCLDDADSARRHRTTLMVNFVEKLKRAASRSGARNRRTPTGPPAKSSRGSGGSTRRKRGSAGNHSPSSAASSSGYDAPDSGDLRFPGYPSGAVRVFEADPRRFSNPVVTVRASVKAPALMGPGISHDKTAVPAASSGLRHHGDVDSSAFPPSIHSDSHRAPVQSPARALSDDPRASSDAVAAGALEPGVLRGSVVGSGRGVPATRPSVLRRGGNSGRMRRFNSAGSSSYTIPGSFPGGRKVTPKPEHTKTAGQVKAERRAREEADGADSDQDAPSAKRNRPRLESHDKEAAHWLISLASPVPDGSPVDTDIAASSTESM